MMSARPIILLEFNELCPDLLSRWMEQGLLPNFRRFYQASRVFTADADETNLDHLEPWIQWYSLHTGFSYQQHGVFNLTDGPRRGLKDVWRLLLDDGYRVGNCAGMNSPGFRAAGSFYLPDPWCNSETAYPPKLQAYQRVVLEMVQENTNSGRSLDVRSLADFVAFWMSHGMSLETISSIVGHLCEEVLDRRQSWKKVVLLDKIQCDIFSHYWRKMRPDFSSFFINSTAHYQHSYFHHLDAADGGGEAAPGSPVHKDAVLFGYQQMDKLLERFFKLEEAGAMLVFSTALSQQPNPRAGLAYYRPYNMEGLMQEVGVRPKQMLPVMAHQYSMIFEDAASTEAAAAAVKTICYDGEPVFEVRRDTQNALFVGVSLHAEVPQASTLEIRGPSPRHASFYDLLYRMPNTKSGAHHPESALWFKTGEFQVNSDKVSILDVLPTLLDYYGATAPREEGMARGGSSLLPKLGIERYARTPVPA
jgi:hypothetical protein